jgi:hypothetical protein
VPRRHRRFPEAPDLAGERRSVGERVEGYLGVDYRVRSLTGMGGGGPYRCPGCDQLIMIGASHVVAWAEHDPEAVDRRHWHTTCWAHRSTRAPRATRR